MTDTTDAKTEVRNYSFQIDETRKVDDKKRQVTVGIASDTPVMRHFGYEILSMEADKLDLSFLNSKRAPLLWGHDQYAKPLGVVESAKLGDDNILRAVIRFSESEEGNEVYEGVKSGIYNNISIGYRVEGFTRDPEDIDDIPVFRSDMLHILEVSIVNIPADVEAYVGRSDSSDTNSVDSEPDTVNSINEDTQDTRNDTNNALEAKQMKDTDNKAAAPVANEDTRAADLEVIRVEATAVETKRASEIFGLAQRHGMVDAGSQYVTEGKSVNDFRAYLLDNLDQRAATTSVQPKSHIDMEAKDDASYSLSRALYANLTGDWSQAGLEREVSNELASRMGRPAEGVYIPEQFLAERAMSVGGTNVGEDLVGTTHLAGEYVSPLYNKSVLAALGARQMGGLVGDIDIPKGGAASFYWLSTETTDITESTPTTGMINLSPKTVGGLVTSSHKLLRQSTPSVDALLRADLLAGAGSAIDLAGINGSGASGQPTGILQTSGIGAVALGTNGAVPTYASVRGLIKEIQIDNLEGTSFLGNPEVTYALTTTAKVASTDSKFIMEDDDKLVGYNYVATNNVPNDLTKGTGTDLSPLIFGDFSSLILASWGVIDVAVSASHGTNFASGQVVLRVMADVDVAVRRAEAFAAIVDMITT